MRFDGRGEEQMAVESEERGATGRNGKGGESKKRTHTHIYISVCVCVFYGVFALVRIF